jgi:K(+)-stimulated pyrophosphate-energized sodium pump
LALFAAFMKTAGVQSIDVSQPDIMAGLLIGGMLPFVFSALSMNAVGRAAMSMIEEVRRQFQDIPQLKAALEVMRKYDSDLSKATKEDIEIFEAADGLAEYEKCVAISTQASIKEMVFPGLLAIAVPVAVGFIGGAEMLGGLLAGVTTAGVLMAIFQSNAGGAWDNAKKTIESQGRKGSDAHKAAVVGDTVGDPFKDTSGPSLNILLKLMSVVALVIAPSLVSLAPADEMGMLHEETKTITVTEEGMKATQAMEKQIRVEVSNTDEGAFKAVVTSSTTTNGEVVEESEEFTAATKEELEQKIQEYKSAEAKN